jgi:putative mycofactocin binding protein MftB
VQSFDSSLPWGLHPQVALRDEAFGALAYHYGNRRLVFLKSRDLVELVRALETHDTADQAITATVPEEDHERYERALSRLVGSEIISVR